MKKVHILFQRIFFSMFRNLWREPGVRREWCLVDLCIWMYEAGHSLSACDARLCFAVQNHTLQARPLGASPQSIGKAAVLSALLSSTTSCLPGGNHLPTAPCGRAAVRLCSQKMGYPCTAPFFPAKTMPYSCCSMHFEHVLFYAF